MAQQSGTTRQQSSGPSILVIDDDKTTLQLIEAVLIEEGFAVSVAGSGQAALQAPLAAPDLIVLDMFLPGISGVDLANALRAKYGGNVPILVTSASLVNKESRALGAYEYLPKPFDLEDLVAAIRRGLPASPS